MYRKTYKNDFLLNIPRRCLCLKTFVYEYFFNCFGNLHESMLPLYFMFNVFIIILLNYLWSANFAILIYLEGPNNKIYKIRLQWLILISILTHVYPIYVCYYT